MNTNDIRDRFGALALGRERTLMARFRDVFEYVDAAIVAGVSYARARDELAELGLDLKLKTFSAFLARIRKERSLIRPTTAQRQDSGPTASQVGRDATLQAANSVAAQTEVPASDTGAAQDAAATRPVMRERRPIAPVGVKLPDDWLTADLTREQKRLLTHEQRRARADAVIKDLWPNPYDPVPTAKK